MSNANPNPTPAPLSGDEVAKLGGAIARLQELDSFSVVTPTHEAEKKGLIEFINHTFSNHATEFIGMWFVANEYRNLIQYEARKLRRVEEVANRLVEQERRQQAAIEAAEKAQQSEPTIVPASR